MSAEELAPLVYEDMRRIAHGLFQREGVGITIQPTAVVHEAYLNLALQKEEGWENRAQFLGVAATAMRRVLIDAARERSQLKRGGGHQRVTLSDAEPRQDGPQLDLLDLEDALQALAQSHPRYAKIAELRHFGGLTIPEVASVLGVSTTIVDREWAKAKAHLAVRLEDLAAERD